MALAYTAGVVGGKLSLERFVAVAAENPARIFGLYPRKGTIAVGSDADLVVWDPNKQLRLSLENLHMRADYAAFPDKVVTGAPKTVLSRGEVVVHDGKTLAKPGRGRFLKRGRPGV